MDSVKTFFAAQNKHTGLINHQQINDGYGHYSGRSLPMLSNGLANGSNGNGDNKLTNGHDMKRKDSDSYFYIMWRS